ncbi:MAG TPA: Ku protein [Pseudonocardiaceae bacterium]|nr:Ku protein [Pseudonocardiaceae bacterium]
MRAMWKGAVSFGLVSIPIQLYAATENKNVSLHQVHEADGARIQYRRFCSAEDKEVPYGEIAKGYELDDGQMVILTSSDLSDLPLSTSRTIDVLEFVDLEAIDPIYFDRSYYLEPQKAAAKAYTLLRDALHKSGHVAVAKVALRQRESLAVLRVYSDVMVLTTMLWPDEVRTPDFDFLHEDAPQVQSREMAMAGSLIDSLTEPVFEPDKFQDGYRAALEAKIEAKISGGDTEEPAAAEDGKKAKKEVPDLVDVLQASVDAAKRNRGSGSRSAKADTKPAPAKSGRKKS